MLKITYLIIPTKSNVNDNDEIFQGAKSLHTSGSYLVDLFYLTARDMDCQKLLRLCVGAWNEDPALFLALIAQVRDREKKGEIFLGRMMMKWYVNTEFQYIQKQHE